ncbi:hypothetical protein [Salirhabdus salicampi]|uniref:hypothetical protein n=1 Tax=Salirhabdus salicampi TaxID=476102 RepID=UPI0020C3CD95|nr:hypothetical protein [Salirhabdus salicampi]MCP8617280.1 hypothetical protein [Salirhabdus salicampi]
MKSSLYTTVIFAFIILTSFAISFVFKRSLLIQDFTYRFLTAILQVKDEVALSISSELNINFWNVLVAMHGGTFQGTVVHEDMEAGSVMSTFTIHLPVIAVTILLFLLLAIFFKGIKRFIPMKTKDKGMSLFLSSLLYLVFLLVTLVLFNPSYTGQGANYELSVPFLNLALSTIIIYLLGGFIGLGPWEGEDNASFKLLSIIHPIKTFVTILFSYQMLILILMVITWNLTSTTGLFGKSITTIATFWYEYRKEPLFYLFLPNVILTEQLYAIGGSWTVTTSYLAELIQLNYPVSLNIMQGANLMVADLEGADWLNSLERVIRWVWHPYALLITFVFALGKSDVKGNWRTFITKVAGVCIMVFVLSKWITISVSSNLTNSTEMIGFNPLQVVISTAILAAIYYISSHFLSTRFVAKKVGGHSE